MKKTFKNILICSSLVIASCQKSLDVIPKSEFSPETVFSSEAGIKTVLFSAYAQEQTQTNSRYWINDSEMCTDMATNSGGAENGQLITIINFTWDPSLGTFNDDMWAPNYRSIRDANRVLDNVDNVPMSDASKKLFRAEAKALRAQAYATLYNYFGTVPLRLSSTQLGDKARATDTEMRTQIEADFTTAIPDLPNPGAEESFGRMNKGVAWGLLAKYYLNTKQWQKAADAALAVMNFNYYSLYPSFPNLFRVENERNREIILALQCRPEDPLGNWFQAGALPPAYKSSPQFPGFNYVGTMSNFATQYRLRTAFTNTFAPTDTRLQLICTSYVNTSNATIDLSTGDNARSFKYWDNATVGNNSGTDVPILRYADILLTRAEALNELSYPSTEAFTLINQVRSRANLTVPLTTLTTPDQSSFRTAMFRERGWEFVSEGKRREDLIRQGTFISLATARGITNANANRVLFPIPQSEMDANRACVQNPGY